MWHSHNEFDIKQYAVIIFLIGFFITKTDGAEFQNSLPRTLLEVCKVRRLKVIRLLFPTLFPDSLVSNCRVAPGNNILLWQHTLFSPKRFCCFLVCLLQQGIKANAILSPLTYRGSHEKRGKIFDPKSIDGKNFLLNVFTWLFNLIFFWEKSLSRFILTVNKT